VSSLILAGGGTGGHVFPLLSVAEALRELRPDLELLFVGTSRGMETRIVPERGYELELLPVLPMRGAGIGGALRGALRAAELLPASRALLTRRQASGVLSIGGYAAGPVSLAASMMGLPLALIEPNSVPGLANLLIAPLVDRVYLGFEEAEIHFSPAKIRQLGVPIRAGFGPTPLSLSSPLRVLVLGGSQGAQSLNEKVPRALARVAAPLRVVHQTGAAREAEVRALYEELTRDKPSLEVQVVPFLQDMQAALTEAHLVVSRSGASAVSEILAVGRPSLLVPYPHASGDHQRHNALELERKGAALCQPRGAELGAWLEAELNRLAASFETLESMAARAREHGRPYAARRIAEDFLNLLKEAP
jgi:UDP-N-acetylglucosamine--N-acetylmuramyl-(pentapeptide) pyrophosphoryl-undecaprenol N-acetylglucosamine transferase